MNRYLCKCGRAVNKSTNADNTGNRETEGCEGCPYLMPWGPTEWDHTRHAMVTDVKGYECRMSPTLEYRTELRGHLDDKTTIRITSLDFDFLERVSDWVKEHYPNGELSGGFSRDRIRPAEYVDEGRYRYTLACSQNKKGIAAKRALSRKGHPISNMYWRAFWLKTKSTRNYFSAAMNSCTYGIDKTRSLSASRNCWKNPGVSRMRLQPSKRKIPLHLRSARLLWHVRSTQIIFLLIHMERNMNLS